MGRPFIAVSARSRAAGQVSNWPQTRATVAQQTYLEGIWRSGANEAILSPRLMNTDEARDVLSRVDGLVLVGGGDVDPALYGQAQDDQVYGVEEANDSHELALVRAALELKLPMLAICRGMQVLNVALGGTLHQHITGKPGFGAHGDPREGHASHSVNVEPATLLAKAIGGAQTIDDCWSFHHQTIDRLGTGLVITATSDDGAVEAVELTDLASAWTVAVQWHPERTADVDPVQQGLFDELSRQATQRMTYN